MSVHKYEDEEHPRCKGCEWNKYPECHAKIEKDGNYFRIDNLVKSYWCNGFRGFNKIYDDSIELKSDETKKIEDLEKRIAELEKLKGV